MSDTDQLKGTPFDERSNIKKTPGSLKALAILTFVGSGITLFLTILQQVNGKKNLDLMEKMQGSDDLQKLPGFLQKLYTPEAMEMARTSYENRVPLFIITLVSLALCVYGAIEMWSLKKQGYFFWIIGNLLPFIGSVIFVGTAAVTGIFSIIFLSIFALFLILYTTHLKYLS